jgi:phage tail protein X
MQQAQYLAHITAVGERWDLLAWTYYGDATLFSPIIMANPQIPIEPVFAAGLHIAVPLLQMNRTTTNMPPWKTTV